MRRLVVRYPGSTWQSLDSNPERLVPEPGPTPQQRKEGDLQDTANDWAHRGGAGAGRGGDRPSLKCICRTIPGARSPAKGQLWSKGKPRKRTLGGPS